MSGSNEKRDHSEWVTASKFYRRRPGLGWLAGLLLVPLLLGAIGYSGLNEPRNDGDATPPNVAPSGTLTTPSAGLPAFAPLSIVRNGNEFTVSGDVADAAAKASLLNTLRASFPGANVVDESNIKTGVNTPNFSGLGPVFDAAVDIPDFNLGINDDTLTLTGNAPSGDSRAAVQSAAKAAWPNQLSNNIRVAAAPAPGSPAPGETPTGTPAPAAGAACADLAGDIGSLLKTPITFATDGSTLTPDSQQLLTQVAGKLAGCPDAEVDVRGYTDDTGNDAINVPLSANRAKSVADFLVAHGVAGDRVSSQGLGSGDPVASNSAPDGRAQNRRVEIAVK